MFVCNAMFPLVDVRDAADAHLNAIEKGRDGERYLIVNSLNSTSLEAMSLYLTKHFLPEGYGGYISTFSKPVVWLGALFSTNFRMCKYLNTKGFRMDNSKSVEELGMDYIGVKEMLRDTGRCLIDKKIVLENK